MIWRSICFCLCLGGVAAPVMASDTFNLDSSRNSGTLRLELDNDTFFDRDSNFSNGWSIQYHTVRYPSWSESSMPKFINWVGENMPGLSDKDSIVRYAHSIGQNMITPGDLTKKNIQPGDLPYAGTLTCSINWQVYNRTHAKNFQLTLGVMGDASLAEQFQNGFHNLGFGKEAEGWDNQRDSEPIFNFAYQYSYALAQFGKFDNDWAGQFELSPSISMGNLFTAVEVGGEFRWGWNIQEGFGAMPAPPGRGFFSSS